MVTVKVLTKDRDNTLHAQSYARSLTNSDRDNTLPTKFAVNTGQNTAFDEALRPNDVGQIPHFFSADLKKHESYNNERTDYLKSYQSVIVVPIKCSGVVGKQQPDDIGFLCVDTRSRNRLNNKYHVIMLSALSDQMYNFMCLMRGKYRVLSEVKES